MPPTVDISVLHSKTSGRPVSGDPGLVQGLDWDDDHIAVAEVSGITSADVSDAGGGRVIAIEDTVFENLNLLDAAIAAGSAGTPLGAFIADNDVDLTGIDLEAAVAYITYASISVDRVVTLPNLGVDAVSNGLVFIIADASGDCGPSARIQILRGTFEADLIITPEGTTELEYFIDVPWGSVVLSKVGTHIWKILAVTPLPSGGGGDHTYNETPTGDVDGVNDTFTLGNAPLSGSLMLFKNGLLQREGSGNDFTISTDTIVFESDNLPQTDDILKASYPF